MALFYHDGSLYTLPKDTKKEIQDVSFDKLIVLLDGSGSMCSSPPVILKYLLRDLLNRGINIPVTVYVFHRDVEKHQNTMDYFCTHDIQLKEYLRGDTQILPALTKLETDLKEEESRSKILITLISDGCVGDNGYGSVTGFINNNLMKVIQEKQLTIYTGTFFPQWGRGDRIDGDTTMAACFNNLSSLVIPLITEQGDAYHRQSYEQFPAAINKMLNYIFTPYDTIHILGGASPTPSGIKNNNSPLVEDGILFVDQPCLADGTPLVMAERDSITIPKLLPTLQRLVGNAAGTDSPQDKQILINLLQTLQTLFVDETEDVEDSNLMGRIRLLRRKTSGAQKHFQDLINILVEERKQVGSAVAGLMMGASQTSSDLRRRQRKYRNNDSKQIHNALTTLTTIPELDHDGSATVITQLSLPMLVGGNGIIKELIDFLDEQDLTVDEVLANNTTDLEIKTLIEEVLGSFSGIPVCLNNNRPHENAPATLKCSLSRDLDDETKPVLFNLGLGDLASLRNRRPFTLPDNKDGTTTTTQTQVEYQTYDIPRMAKFKANGICPLITRCVSGQIPREACSAFRVLANTIASMVIRGNPESVPTDAIAVTCCTALALGKEKTQTTMLKDVAKCLVRDMKCIVRPTQTMNEIGEKLFRGESVDFQYAQEGFIALLYYLLDHSEINHIPPVAICRILSRTAYLSMRNDANKVEYLRDDTLHENTANTLSNVMRQLRYLISFLQLVDREITIDDDVQSLIRRCLLQSYILTSAEEERTIPLPLTDEILEININHFLSTYLLNNATNIVEKMAVTTDNIDLFVDILKTEQTVTVTFGKRKVNIKVKLPKSARNNIFWQLESSDETMYKIWILLVGINLETGETSVLEENQSYIRIRKFYDRAEELLKNIQDGNSYSKLREVVPNLITQEEPWFVRWRPANKGRTCRKRKNTIRNWIYNRYTPEVIARKLGISTTEGIKDAIAWYHKYH